MESTNFNLQQSIDDYIRQISNQGSITSSDAKELSTHLYDETEDLQKQGLSEEEGFFIACKRLGNKELLTDEYSKVNTSLNTNKIWAYLFIGFNLLYTLPSLMLIGIVLLYREVYLQFQDSGVSTLIITSFHLLFISFIWLIIKNKNLISNFMEKQVNTNALRIVSFSFLLLLVLFTVNSRLFNIHNYTYLYYPVYHFNSIYTEFSFYLAALSIVGGLLGLVFSINKTESLTLNTLFEKPSIVFLISFGVFIELLAASTRVLGVNMILLSALLFGLVYLAAAFLLTYYNKQGNNKRGVFLFSLFGIIMETGVGIIADLDRGNTHYTIYFVAAMLIGIVSGRLLGLKAGSLMIA